MKPYVLCHMVSSIDGRIWGSRWRPRANVVPNLFETLHDRLVAEAGGAPGAGGSWLCGRVTAQEFARGKGKVYPPTSERFARENWYAMPEAKRRAVKAWGIFLDAQGRACWERGDVGGDPILVILTARVPDSHLAGLRRDGVSYIFAGAEAIDLADALETLNRDLGITRLLLEGGGGANGALLRAGLVDEISLVVAPVVDGSTGGPIVLNSGDPDLGPAPVERMTLASHTVLEGGAVWLRYRLSNG